MTQVPDPLERLLRHDRRVVAIALLSVVAIAWIYTLSGAGMGQNALEMSGMPAADSSARTGDMAVTASPSVFVLLVMWWVMMVAMMLPSATPVILLTAALNRRSTAQRPPYGKTAFFTLGYLAAWFIFSLAAALAQVGLDSNGLMSSMMQSNSTYLTAGLLIAAGAWQFTSIKQACLRHCRSPIDFITRHRRPGNRGALVMGLHHGTYCLGCCWFLMALLFAGGVMNIYWIAGLALFVLVEKLFSAGVWFGRVAGAGLVVTGAALLLL